MLATKQRDAAMQRQALDYCKADPHIPAERLESIAALCKQGSNLSSASLQLAQDALKTALLKRLKHLAPDSTVQTAQVSQRCAPYGPHFWL